MCCRIVTVARVRGASCLLYCGSQLSGVDAIFKVGGLVTTVRKARKIFQPGDFPTV